MFERGGSPSLSSIPWWGIRFGESWEFSLSLSLPAGPTARCRAACQWASDRACVRVRVRVVIVDRLDSARGTLSSRARLDWTARLDHQPDLPVATPDTGARWYPWYDVWER